MSMCECVYVSVIGYVRICENMCVLGFMCMYLYVCVRVYVYNL